MHYRYFVVFEKDKAKNSSEAREYVKKWLDDNGFASESGRFCSPMADWYVIGGRWSGELTRSQIDQTKLKELWKEFETRELGWINNTDKTEEVQREKTRELFNQFFPNFKERIPFTYFRNQYNTDGYGDDAQIVNEKIWDNLLQSEVTEGDSEGFCHVEQDGELTKDSCVGNYWCVVVDYHN